MRESLLDKVKAFDKSGNVRTEVDKAMKSLKDFRTKYPFAENPESIESLDPNDIFNEQSDEVGVFFHYIEYYLRPIGHLTIYGSNVYRQIRSQFEDFKELLYVVVDKKKSLAEKVDAPWDEIRGLGQDRHIAKKIIFCFNYEDGNLLPIFKTTHLEHFFNEIVDKPSSPAKYVSLGEKYEYLISELLKVKENLQETQSWELPYFSGFLYDSYTPPFVDEPPVGAAGGTKIHDEKRDERIQFGEFTKILNELQRKGKISNDEYRDYAKLWREQLQDRESLAERLRTFLNKQS